MVKGVVFTKKSRRELEKLDRFVQKRIIEKIKVLSKDPLGYSSKLSDPSIGSYRFRIGSYRVIFDIDGARIVILAIGHRRDIYSKI